MPPLVLVSGYLGAGKTSFLRRLLPQLAAGGIAPIVIVNDYQNAQVDALLLRELSQSITPISGTCVCCDSRDELMGTLATITLPEKSVVLLEANGTADTVELLEFLAADKRTARFTLPVQINIVDATRWQHRHWNNDIEALQTRTATFLSITRRDEASDARWNEVIASLQKLNPHATIATDSEFASLIAQLVLDAPQKVSRSASLSPSDGERAGVRGHRHGHEKHHFAALELPLPHRIAGDTLLKFLNDLPAAVVRAKGVAILDTEPAESVVFQKVEGRDNASLMKLGNADDVHPVIILVGPRLPDADLRHRIASLVSSL